MSISLSSENLQAQNERFLLGEITATAQIDPTILGMTPEIAPAAITTVEVRDPYVEMFTAAEVAEVKFMEQAANDFAAARREQGAWDRRPGTAYVDPNSEVGSKKEWGDPASRDKFFEVDLNNDGIKAWKTWIPSAIALEKISDPTNMTEITSADGLKVPFDRESQMWLSLCTDGVGIRSRATVMAEIVENFALTEQERVGDDAPLRWLSVACGTALPSMQGAMRAGIKPELLLADFDINAMSETERLASEIGFEGTISLPAEAAIGEQGINIFDPSKMQQLKEYLEANGGLPQMIDLMGIFEYTGDNLGVDSAGFLKSCYDLLAPGGQLVFGQMRSDRRVADFTMGVVSWPYIEMRTPAEFMTIIKDAEINPADTRLFLPSDGTYTVGVISKPATTKLHAVA